MAVSVSIVASTVEEPPLPGGRYPREFLTACFDASAASIGSVTYSFQSSFGAAPSVFGGQPTGSYTASFGHVWTSSVTANDVTIIGDSNDGANASFLVKSTLWFTE